MTEPTVEPVSLHLAARDRYLSYALSVITSRALPDVRDGLKPVHRRILYTMSHDMGLSADARYRKCAAVVGEVMGKYHPHGDSSIYESLVRMAQDFSLRVPLVDGQGNFGSLDGDPAAAMRYTECKLQAAADELLSEIPKEVVDVRPTYDGQANEPVVLPARFPHLLVNGAEGIAVGLATKIPPHNLGEIIDATILLLEKPTATVPELLRKMPGPDFPTAGRLLADGAQLREIYETGHGTFKLRAEWTVEQEGRRKLLVITSVPYGQNKARLIERIGAEVEQKRLPMVTDVRDESTEVVRIVIEMKGDSDPQAVMAVLYKRTPLEVHWPVNITALIPGVGQGPMAPSRLDLVACLRHWLDFRQETVRKRLRYDLGRLRDRIHVLEGFAKVFNILDEIIRLIRESEGRREAAEKMMDAFGLSEVQTDAILELRLYRLARLEIQLILEELAQKEAEARRIQEILDSETRLADLIKDELREIKRRYGSRRRTTIEAPVDEPTVDEQALLGPEDTFVVVTRDGWFKRQSSLSEVTKVRVRDGDAVVAVVRTDVRATVSLLTDQGTACTIRAADVPQTTGHGEPIQRHFKLGDGEHLAAILPHDVRHKPQAGAPAAEGDPPPPYAVGISRQGRVFRFAPTEDASTKAGRRYCKLDDGDFVFRVLYSDGGEHLALATAGGRVARFPVAEIPVLRAPGKGVTGIKLQEDKFDEIIEAALVRDGDEGPIVETPLGRKVNLGDPEHNGPRGGKGAVILKRGQLQAGPRPVALWLGPEGLTKARGGGEGRDATEEVPLPTEESPRATEEGGPPDPAGPRIHDVTSGPRKKG